MVKPGLSANGTAPRPPGRPRNPANTILIEALIARQDAMSRRTARRINDILDTHVNIGAAAYVWARGCRLARARMAVLVDTMCTKLGQRSGLRAEIEPLVAEALEELHDDAIGPPPAEMPPEEPRPRVLTSHTLAEARAQSARLQTFLMDLRARVVRLEDARESPKHRKELTS